MAATSRLHAGDDGATQEDRRQQVHANELLDLAGRERAERTGEVEARIVDEHVDRAVGFDTHHERPDRVGIGEVSRICVATEIGCELVEPLPRAGDERDTRPAPRALGRQRRADAPRAARDDDTGTAQVNCAAAAAALSRSIALSSLYSTLVST